jgi:hypothetical protein
MIKQTKNSSHVSMSQPSTAINLTARAFNEIKFVFLVYCGKWKKLGADKFVDKC